MKEQGHKIHVGCMWEQHKLLNREVMAQIRDVQVKEAWLMAASDKKSKGTRPL